jgi:hypothetical protein
MERHRDVAQRQARHQRQGDHRAQGEGAREHSVGQGWRRLRRGVIRSLHQDCCRQRALKGCVALLFHWLTLSVYLWGVFFVVVSPCIYYALSA